MTRTITKPARDLAVGDVLPARPDSYPRRVVYHVHQAGENVAPHTMPTAPVRPALYPPEMYAADVAVEVEAPTLTPAQLHAELFEKYAREFLHLSQNSGPAGFASVSEFKTLRDALDQVRPPNPPTLQEALDALSVLYEGTKAARTGEWDHASMQVARNQAHAVVERARRAGIL